MKKKGIRFLCGEVVTHLFAIPANMEHVALPGPGWCYGQGRPRRQADRPASLSLPRHPHPCSPPPCDSPTNSLSGILPPNFNLGDLP